MVGKTPREIGAVLLLGVLAAMIIWWLIKQQNGDPMDGSEPNGPRVTVTEKAEPTDPTDTTQPIPPLPPSTSTIPPTVQDDGQKYLQDGVVTVLDTFEVGVDIPAGTYATDGPADDGSVCEWFRLSEDVESYNAPSAILESGVITGPASIVVKTGEFIELASPDCEWRYVQ